MLMCCRPVEANANVCRQTGLRGADRREMASTCCITGPSTPLHPTGCRVHLVLQEASRGFDVLLSSYLYPVFFLNHLKVNATRLPFHLTFNITFSLAEICFSFASPSLSVGVCSLLIVLVSLRLSFNAINRPINL